MSKRATATLPLLCALIAFGFGFIPGRGKCCVPADPDVEVCIIENGMSIQDTTQDVIVGERINLSPGVGPGGYHYCPYLPNWDIPGIRYHDWVANAQTGGPPVPLDNPAWSVSFFWVDGGTETDVTVTVDVDGLPYSATATFDVYRPAISLSAFYGQVTSDDQLMSHNQLHYGVFDPLPPGVKLIRGAIPAGFGGETQWIQVVNSVTLEKEVSEGSWEAFAGGGGLDTYMPYPPYPTDDTMEDSPAMPEDEGHQGQEDYRAYLQVYANEDLTAWLMYRPSSQDALVPILKTHWGWSAWAAQSGSTWPLVGKPATPHDPPTSCTDYPIWSRNAADNDWEPME